ncbi:hypothetical protein RvVAT039_pl12860 (plasmid) [Agrobacterium vitis]|uniref:cyclic GMP-AMP synthase DncV-like nucleotidyltransferase n=1 Tax=Agrobacterium vitis TaxID=373 RepID=UPI0015DB4BE8|nr:hypothetical protein [Agrobacterium vitis]BCH68453.1 hypothetical protein RvVAT039_pl12860 [Agrobacterium vitis]
MFNSHDDMTAFHNSEVRLPLDERDTMRERRNTNRTRLKDGLKRDGEPKPVGCHTQGSYAMRTMIQHSAKDYDIDDGAYFKKSDLVGSGGADKSASAAKEMVRKAVHKDTFNRVPECLKNCVRVYYNEGFHVDIPVYRTFERYGDKVYELASSDWKASDALAVTEWFKKANKDKSPNTDNYGQMNRIVKLMKAFARSRESWRSRIATGFMITKLVEEKYLSLDKRDDQTLRDTMRAIYNRLEGSLVIYHPVLNETLTNGDDDARAKFLRDKLGWALSELAVLDNADCTEDKARKAWDSVFNTDFFTNRGASKKAEAVTSAAVLLGATERAAAERAFDKRGGDRYG